MNNNGEKLTDPKPAIKPTLNSLTQDSSSVSNPNPNSGFDDSEWGYCTEEAESQVPYINPRVHVKCSIKCLAWISNY